MAKRERENGSIIYTKLIHNPPIIALACVLPFWYSLEFWEKQQKSLIINGIDEKRTASSFYRLTIEFLRDGTFWAQSGILAAFSRIRGNLSKATYRKMQLSAHCELIKSRAYRVA